MDTSGHADPMDRDRMALSRFIGAWDFQGWYEPLGEPRRNASGRAAGTIEHEHFLLLDSARRVEQAGTVETSVGSMILSAEPGIGMMMTAWSDASPVMHRLRGRVEAEGSYFVFDEANPVWGNERLRMVLRFETDDRWVTEIFRSSGFSWVLAASYTFTRSS